MSGSIRGALAKCALLAGLSAGAAWGQLSVTCNPAALPQLVGSVVSVACSATNGTGPYTWSISAGALPPGLSQNPSTGDINGTLMDPAGQYSFTVTATDTVPPNATGNQVYSGTTVDNLLEVHCLPTTGPVEVGVAYSSSCTASGGTQPYSWSIAPGTTTPPGITITPTGNPATVNLTPSAPLASYTYHVLATDSSVPAESGYSAAFTGSIVAAVTIATASPLPTAAANSPYSLTFAAANGVPGYTWLASGLPSWLIMSSGGLLTGTPPAASPVTFNVTVTDSVGGTSTGTFTLPVNPALAITTNSPLPAAAVGTAYNQTLAATGGAATPYTWSATDLPSWLSLSTSGVLTGTPTSASVDSTFTVTVKDASNNTASKPFALLVTLGITTTSPLPTATIGAAYSQTFAAAGGAGGYLWSATGPPSWLSLSSGGVLTGNPPPTATDATFTVKVTDSANVSATGSFTVPVALAITTTSPLPAATVNAAYSQTLTAGGGSGVNTWSATGLPSWLSLSPTGVLSGTPPASAVNAIFTVKVTDSLNVSASTTFTVPVNLTIITTSPLPAATAQTAYMQTLVAGGGAGGYTWSATGLPTWLSLSSTGVLSGTPPSAGPVTFNVTVKDSSNATHASSFTLPVNPVALAISTNSPLASGTVGASYSQTLAGTGGVPPYTWSVTGGSLLPGGLELNSGSGVISGTPNASGTFTFTIQLSDSASTTPASKQFTITIATGLTITTAPSLPNGIAGVAYSQTIQAAGGNPPYTWSLTAGSSLPANLGLNSTSGVISGTPAAAGASTFTIQVTDSKSVTSSKSFTLTVSGALSVTTASLPNGTVGVTYSQTITAGGGAPPYSWSIVSGSPPTGTALNSGGILSGTPSSAASFTFTVQVADSSSHTATKAFTVAIVAGVTITTAAALPNGNIGTPYSQTLAATGGTPPYSWVITSGGLPVGLALSATGVIGGTPTASGTSGLTVQVTDSVGAKGSKTFTLTIVSALSISTTSPLPAIEVGVLYSQTLTAVGGAPPYIWSLVSGALPSGLTFSAGGVITGTPAAAGPFTFTVKATDGNSVSATRVLALTVAARVTITTPAALNGGSVAAPYSQTLAATGGLPPYNWSLVSGALPAGLGLSTAGVISGSPNTPGTFTFTARVTDAAGVTATQQFTIVTATGLIISSPAILPGGVVGAAYSQTLRAAGGAGPYTWTVTAGALPIGLSLASSGVISGTPTGAGKASFTAQVTDSTNRQASQPMSIAIELQPSVTTSALPNAVAGVAYSQGLAAAGGTPPYSWSITTGNLPAGLALSPAGAISGTPTAGGTFTFTVQVTDSFSVTAAKSLSIAVTGTLSISTAATLPDGAIGSSYSQPLTAAGGTPPYIWTLTSGSLPAGLTLGAAGTITGTPTAVGTSTFTLQVKGATVATASQQFTLVIVTGLTISTATALPGATAGTAYSQPLTAAGGIPPYQWSVVKGALPAGLTLNASSGIIGGTPTAGGSFSITAQVADASSATASQAFTLVVSLPAAPSASLTGLQSTATPLQQLSGGLTLAAGYPLDITVQATLTFQPDAVNEADDPSIQFSTGGRTATFTIPHGTTTGESFKVQTGSVAGTITLNVTLQAGGVSLPTPSGLSQTIRIARVAPVITGVTASSASGGLQVLVTGYSNTREVTQAVVQFTAAAGQTLQTTSVTVALTDAANTWFKAAGSDQYGSQFVLTLPFTVSGGGAGAVGSVSVTLTNTVGTSNSMSGSS